MILQRIDRLSTVREGVPDDLYLVCAGYEERSSAVTARLASDYHAHKAVIYVNTEFSHKGDNGRTQLTLLQLREILKDHCENVEEVEGSWLNPVTQLRALKGALITGKSQINTVTLDVTSFNRESLLVATLLLRTGKRECLIRVASTSPQTYGEWLTRGFRGVRNVMGFSGLRRATRPTVLVVLSGFESERTLRIIEEHEPTEVLVGIGDGPRDEMFAKRNLFEQQLTLNRQGVNRFYFPTTSIDGCATVLEELLRGYLDTYNVVLAPMSTKISTLAALVVAERHQDIQITYCVPGEYNNTSYSAGIGDITVQYMPNGMDIVERHDRG